MAAPAPTPVNRWMISVVYCTMNFLLKRDAYFGVLKDKNTRQNRQQKGNSSMKNRDKKAFLPTGGRPPPHTYL